MKKTAAALLASLALATPAAAAEIEEARYDPAFLLEPNTTETYRVTLTELGKQCNTLQPGWGLEVRGPGVDLALGMFSEYFGGPLVPELDRENQPDGGIPGAYRKPDGSLWKPRPDATPFTPRQVQLGMSLREVDWDWQRLDLWGNPMPASGVTRPSEAAKRLRARRLRAARKKVVRRAAQDSPVTITVAGFEVRPDGAQGAKYDMVAEVTTGALAGPTTLRLHARVAILPATRGGRPVIGCRPL
jgi:hypothetical protein